ncbi:hypothetical protein CDCA_CDCA09G2847 [Cyanidium caldarium]|uniref:Uncharacterized protein n=1 Tax=Cyanidium caldarium TaxID=2771 RepID=A0AAV9IWW2_CYACA|nr:hypothetical protein CDCA_CDCA09G2847 [Cyanidium caldarium]
MSSSSSPVWERDPGESLPSSDVPAPAHASPRRWQRVVSELRRYREAYQLMRDRLLHLQQLWEEQRALQSQAPPPAPVDKENVATVNRLPDASADASTLQEEFRRLEQLVRTLYKQALCLEDLSPDPPPTVLDIRRRLEHWLQAEVCSQPTAAAALGSSMSSDTTTADVFEVPSTADRTTPTRSASHRLQRSWTRRVLEQVPQVWPEPPADTTPPVPDKHHPHHVRVVWPRLLMVCGLSFVTGFLAASTSATKHSSSSP